jgi:hypothetical protein
MVIRGCAHCESEIEVMADSRVTCPCCGLDPDLAPLAFEDAPAFSLAGDPWALDDPIRAAAGP